MKKRAKKIRVRLPYDKHTTLVTSQVAASHGLADGGTRTATLTGSLRERPADHNITHGRFDLIPPECLALVYDVEPLSEASAFELLYVAMQGKGSLYEFATFARFLLCQAGSLEAGIKRLAVHYGRGAMKYSDRNWQKGQQTGWLVDSLFAHIVKLKAGATDEDHLAAAVWNVFAIMWTIPRIADGHLPRELDTYGLVPK